MPRHSENYAPARKYKWRFSMSKKTLREFAKEYEISLWRAFIYRDNKNI